ncbi:MAG: putative transcriptional regulator [Thermoleophilia bacterium]|nr:putative transcriptional regulator [Thermoleophilia bacterium]
MDRTDLMEFSRSAGINLGDDLATRRAGAPASRAEISQMTDRATIAIESLRAQWRTVAQLGTHERMAISQLRVYGAMPMSELASRISLSRAAVTSLVDRLESAGWVRRTSDASDRRRTVLSLLPHAAEEYDLVTQPYTSELEELAVGMSADEWRTVSTFLAQLSEIAERHTGELRSTAAERALT